MLYDPERRWAPRAICRVEDWPLFFAEGGMPHSTPAAGAKKLWDQAKEICASCPALMECERDTLGEEYGVWGGRDQHQRALARKALPRKTARWSDEKREAWGKELFKLRQARVNWPDIRRQTGFPQPVAEKLITAYQEALKSRTQPVAEVVDLPLPTMPADPVKTPFPPRAGQRHGWVRNGRGLADAYYRGQTPDGRWLFMTHFSGRGNVHKWIKAEDVQLYHPQPVVILTYGGRPDAKPRAREPAA